MVLFSKEGEKLPYYFCTPYSYVHCSMESVQTIEKFFSDFQSEPLHLHRLFKIIDGMLNYDHPQKVVTKFTFGKCGIVSENEKVHRGMQKRWNKTYSKEEYSQLVALYSETSEEKSLQIESILHYHYGNNEKLDRKFLSSSGKRSKKNDHFFLCIWRLNMTGNK